MTGFPGELGGAQQDEVNVYRFTSETVLTVGVKQGWADPEDPRKVDFSTRPSVFGALEFDTEGRPLNPYRTPGMPGDRGELGKWGVNNAADPIVIAIDEMGKKNHILLIQRSEGDNQWALPGGMVDPGELASLTAKRELREEAGIDLTEAPAEVVYKGYVKDHRNTRNAWIETDAALIVIDHTPDPQADAIETLGAGWFELNSVQQLQERTGPLYASHADIVQAGLTRLRERQG